MYPDELNLMLEQVLNVFCFHLFIYSTKWSGVCGCSLRGCSGGVCVVAPGGACVVAQGACMVAPGGACVVALGGCTWFFVCLAA